jgi:hypothetical protein
MIATTWARNLNATTASRNTYLLLTARASIDTIRGTHKESLHAVPCFYKDRSNPVINLKKTLVLKVTLGNVAGHNTKIGISQDQ